MCPAAVTDTGVRKWVRISALKAEPNVDRVGAIPEQPSPRGVWEGALVDLAVMLQLLALSVTQITVHYRNSLFPNCPESYWRNRGVGVIRGKQQQHWSFLGMWQSSSISLWVGRGRVIYLPMHTYLSAHRKWHHPTLGTGDYFGIPTMFVALEWVGCLSACSSSGSDQTQVSRLFSQFMSPFSKPWNS